MIRQERLSLESLGMLSALGVPALEQLHATGEELAAHLENYVQERPDSSGWPVWKKHAINQILFPLLCRQTSDHCSYCDGYPMTDDMTEETIEHFRPKSGRQGRPDLRLTWSNLFACCSGCQRAKADAWHDALLKPDEADYHFDDWFSCEFTTGMLVPKQRLSAEQKERALQTIQLYNLNRYAARRMDMFQNDPWFGERVARDKKPFRYWFDALAPVRPLLPPPA